MLVVVSLRVLVHVGVCIWVGRVGARAPHPCSGHQSLRPSSTAPPSYTGSLPFIPPPRPPPLPTLHPHPPPHAHTATPHTQPTTTTSLPPSLPALPRPAPQVAPLAIARGSLGFAALEGRVYACGGGQANDYYDTIEILDPGMNAWMTGGCGAVDCSGWLACNNSGGLGLLVMSIPDTLAGVARPTITTTRLRSWTPA